MGWLFLIPVVIAVVFFVWFVVNIGNDKAVGVLFGAPISFIIWVFLSMILMLFIGEKHEECSEIISIGGCNRYECGVRMSNGSKERVPTPVIGERVCHDRWIIK